MTCVTLAELVNRLGVPQSKESLVATADYIVWDWLRAMPSPALSPDEPTKTICFSGFVKADKDDLTKLAELSRFRVVGSVSRRLGFLCIGPTPGLSKLRRAAEWKIPVVAHDGFYQIASRGAEESVEIPELVPSLDQQTSWIQLFEETCRESLLTIK